MMNTTLKDFLSNRKAEIKAQINVLKKELQDIQAAEGAIVSDNQDNGIQERKRRKSSRITIKDMIVSVLSDRPQGADSFQIIDMIKEKYDKEIPRPSMSPQLSRLKNDDNEIALCGDKWVLLSAKQEIPTPSSPLETTQQQIYEYDPNEEVPF